MSLQLLVAESDGVNYCLNPARTDHSARLRDDCFDFQPNNNYVNDDIPVIEVRSKSSLSSTLVRVDELRNSGVKSANPTDCL